MTLSAEQQAKYAADVRAAVEAFNRHGENIESAARELGVSRSTLRGRLATAGAVRKEKASTPPPPPPEVAPVVEVRPTYRISQKGGATGEKIKVLAIGDAHDSPSIPDKARFRWMGRHARECGADVLLSIGDMFSLDSLCSHERNDTLRGKVKPSFKQDMASAKDALAAVREGLDGFKPELHITLGNHEDRIFSFTNRTPEIAEMLEENLHTILTDYGWHYSPYGAIHYIGGVGFTHIVLNTMGRPYGGMYAENQIARDSLEDMVFGHSHKRVDKSYPKTNDRHLRVINLGCALPDGHIEPYAKHSMNGWTYGIHEILIQHGRIQHCHEIPMTHLEEMYG